MTPAAFRAWRHRLALKQIEVAVAFGVSIDTVKSWEAGRNGIRPMVEMACRELERRSRRRRKADPSPPEEVGHR